MDELTARDVPIPSFCEWRTPLPDDPHNCRAITDAEYEDWGIPEGSLLQLSSQGRLLSVVPGRDTEWMGVPFAAGHPVEFLGGEPRRGVLAREVVLDRIPLAAYAAVSVAWVADAVVVYEGTLARDHWMQGFPCAGGTTFTRSPDELLASFHPFEPVDVGGLRLAAGSEVRFQNIGTGHRLWRGTLDRSALISEIPCAAGHPVQFDAESHLTQATLSEDLEVGGEGGRCWARETEVRLVRGAIVAGTLARPATLGGIPCKEGPVRLEDGQIPIDCVLERDHVVDGYPCLGGSRVSRRADPSVPLGHRYELSGPYKSHGVSFERGDVITTRSGEGEAWPTVVLASARSIRGIALPSGSEVMLVGKLLRTLTLRPSRALELEGKRVPSGSEIALDLLGRVRAVIPAPEAGESYRQSAR